MKATLIASAAVFLTVAAADTPSTETRELPVPVPGVGSGVIDRLQVVPVLAPTAGNLVGVETGEAAVPSLEPESQPLSSKRGIPAALYNGEHYPYGVPRVPRVPRVPKLTLTTPAPAPAPTPKPITARRGEGDEFHANKDSAAAAAEKEVVSVVINGETILIPQEGIPTVHAHEKILARPTNVHDEGPHHYGHPQQAKEGGGGGVGELVATVIKGDISTTLAIGVQPTVVPLGKRCQPHNTPPPVLPEGFRNAEEDGFPSDDSEKDDDDDDDKDDEDPKDPEKDLKHNEILVYYGNDLIYIPLDGPASISYGPKPYWTDPHQPRPHSTVETATVVQNGWSVTLGVSDLARALPLGKTWPAQFLHSATATADTAASTTKDGGSPMVTGYPPEWNSLHPRLVSSTSADIPAPAATVKSLPSTFMTAARPTPHKLHGEHDREDTTF